jgi:hypothetical protein
MFITNILGTPGQLRRRVTPMLDPAERVEAVFQARRGPNPHLPLLAIPAIAVLKLFVSTLLFVIILIPIAPLPAAAIMLTSTFVVVGVTDRRLAVFGATPFKPAVPTELVETHPRARLSLNHWPVWQAFRMGGNRYWVARRFFRQLRAANVEREETVRA